MNSAKNSRDYYKGLLDEVEKKVEDEHLLHENALKSIQNNLDKSKAYAKALSEAHEKEIERLKAENERLQGDKDLELSHAYSAGFAAYLQNFLATNPDYDWAPHFAPSTPAYMIKFKADHVGAITKANEDLQARIQKELAALADKQEKAGEGAEGDKDEDIAGISPSNTIISWLSNLITIAGTLGVQALH